MFGKPMHPCLVLIPSSFTASCNRTVKQFQKTPYFRGSQMKDGDESMDIQGFGHGPLSQLSQSQGNPPMFQQCVLY